MKTTIDEKLDSIIKSKEIKRIYRETSGPYVYENIKNLVSRNVEDWYERWVITRRIFLDYVKNSSAFNNKKNSKENTLMMMMTYLDEETLSFLLSSGLNYQYTCKNGNGILLDELALNVQNPGIMNMIIREVNNQKLYFGNERRSCFTDLCSMNVLAGNLDQALEIFNRDNFVLIPVKAENELDKHDCLLRIVKNLVSLKEDKMIKIAFLDNILYSNKIKYFNIEILDLIKSICSEDKIKEYSSYFYSKKGIILYKYFDKDNREIIIKENKVKRK